MAIRYIYDYDLIDVVGDGSDGNPWRPALTDHPFLDIETWVVIDDDQGLMLDVRDESGFGRIAKRYRDALRTERALELGQIPKTLKEKIDEREQLNNV